MREILAVINVASFYYPVGTQIDLHLISDQKKIKIMCLVMSKKCKVYACATLHSLKVVQERERGVNP